MAGSPRRASSRLTSSAMSWPRDKTHVRHRIRGRVPPGTRLRTDPLASERPPGSAAPCSTVTGPQCPAASASRAMAAGGAIPVPVRAAERHGQECRLLRHLAIHADIIEIRCQKRIGQNLAVEKPGGGYDRRSAAQAVKENSFEYSYAGL